LNWILIYGHCGSPAMGLVGAGWATLLARMAIAGCMAGYILSAPKLRPFRPVRWRAVLRFERLTDLLHLGGPMAVQHLLEMSAFALAAVMMGWIGAVAIAAHQVAITCAATTFMFALGIGQAVCIRVGHAFGAGQPARMRRIGFSGAALAMVIMGSFGIVLMTMGRPIAELFIRSPEVVTLAGRLLLVAAVFQVADGLQVVSISALRGLNDVRVPAVIAMLAYWAVALPLGWALAFPAGLGAQGLWIGLAAGLGIAAVLLSWRFHRRTRRAAIQLLSPRELPVAGLDYC
jgi:MATE family multidrug resistance protein